MAFDMKEYQKQYRVTHKEQIRLTAKKYRNKPEAKEREKLYRKKNKDKLKAYHQNWRKTHQPPKNKLIHHHTKYKELHGIDEVVILTESEHKLLHNRLRREGKCKISAKELNIISAKARSRSDYQKATNSAKYCYRSFYSIERGWSLFESIRYSPITGKVRYNSSFYFNSY